MIDSNALLIKNVKQIEERKNWQGIDKLMEVWP